MCGSSGLFHDVPSQRTVRQQDVELNGANPFKRHACRVKPVKRALMKKLTDSLLTHGFAHPSSSPWSSLSFGIKA